MKMFEQVLHEHHVELERSDISTLQVNIGKRCNQRCIHCHVNAGPDRIENMTRETIDRLLELLDNEPQIHTIDITGGAPELNPHFRYFVTGIKMMDKEVIDRSNLTVLFEEGQENTADFLADKKVRIAASLPCYMEENVDRQRGKGVFKKSIAALVKLNSLGYGKEGSGLILNLVYNPLEERLPPTQAKLEADYEAHLRDQFGIEFNNLFVITNMPINRYAKELDRNGKIEEYMRLLIDNFNPKAALGVMCTDMVSIGWDGQIYDCDFNQMLGIHINGQLSNLYDIESFSDINSSITMSSHCFGCTAGEGSSCGGTLT